MLSQRHTAPQDTLIAAPTSTSETAVNVAENVKDYAPNSSALFSGNRRYRYSLVRNFEEFANYAHPHHVIFICLNPSTADAFKNDPTVRRCITYARDWGYHGLVVLNIFGLRSTDPKALYVADDPVGAFNDAAIKGCIIRYEERQVSFGQVFKSSPMVICAWGSHGNFQNRGEAVRMLLSEANVLPHYLRLNKDGQPAHPLYLPKTLVPIPWK